MQEVGVGPGIGVAEGGVWGADDLRGVNAMGFKFYTQNGKNVNQKKTVFLKAN